MPSKPIPFPRLRARLIAALLIAALVPIHGAAHAAEASRFEIAPAPRASVAAPGEDDTPPLVAALPEKDGGQNQHRARSHPVVHAETDPTSTERFSYIVQLQDAPLATYRGGVRDLLPTTPAVTGARRLDRQSAASQRYRAYLAERRLDFRTRAETLLGRALTTTHEYDTVFNGVALQITPQEAVNLLALEGVASIQRDQLRFPATNDSPTFLGVPDIWDGSATGGAPGTQGEGIIIGVIDSGIWPEHPSFADPGDLPAPPAHWQGECVPPADDTLAYSCSRKIIGIQYFLSTYISVIGYDGLFLSGRDDSGHGTHTASTAAGNANVPVALYGINRGTVSGIAPRAHIAAYKGLGPRGGFTSDLVAAIEAAVEDGVDVINYSIGGSSSDPWADADALAFLAARAAGVFVATSAGNDGPGAATIGSPANAPWVTAVGASYANRLYLSEITLSGPGAPGDALTGATITAGISDFRLVDAESVPNVNGMYNARCDAPFAPGSFQSTDAVICQRGGGIATWAMGNFVNAGGAGAVILYNDETAFDLNSYLHPIPAVVVHNDVGELLKQRVADHPGQMRISFTAGEKIYAPDPHVAADTVAGFSARGPAVADGTTAVLSIIKPDLTAPGVHILAGASPQHVSEVNGAVGVYGAQDQQFQLIQGTSMSSPHMAGMGALLRSLHPDWSPSEIQSALMSTADAAHQARGAAGDGVATAFDMGAGRVDVRAAANAGLVLEESVDDFVAADPGRGGDPAHLNLASVSDGYCVGSCTWTRVLRSTLSTPMMWNATTNSGPMVLDVQPRTFTLEAGGVQTITISANVEGLPLHQWQFGQVDLTPTAADASAAHLPVAVRPHPGDTPAEITIETRRSAGVYTVEDLSTISAEQLAVHVYTDEPQISHIGIPADPTNGDPYDWASGGVYSTTVTVPNGAKRLVVETTEATARDLDLYVGRDTNGNGAPDVYEELCASTSNSVEEFCAFPQPGDELTPGTYWILVQNWAGSGAAEDTFTLSVLLLDADETGLITGTGPISATVGVPYDLQLSWDLPGFVEGEQVFGVVELVDAATDVELGSTLLTLSRLADDVSFDVAGAATVEPGDTLTYTIDIEREPTTTELAPYVLTSTLPAGTTYVPGSATIPPTLIAGNQLRWEIDLAAQRGYQMSTNQTDPQCDTGFGGYVNLADFEIFPQPLIAGNAISARFDDFFNDDNPADFYGVTYPDGLYVSDDGFGYFDPDLGPLPGANTALPNPNPPNNLIAPFWRDLEIVYDAANNRGVSVAGTAGGLMIVEYDAVEPAPAGSTEDRYTFEFIMARTVDDEPGAYEIVLAYGDMDGPLAPATIGVENADGTLATMYAYNNAVIPPGLIICFDWAVPQAALTYQVAVDGDVAVPSTLTGTLEHTIELPGYKPATTEATVDVTDVDLAIDMHGPAFVPEDAPITYTLSITNSGSGAAADVTVEFPLPVATELIGPGSVENGVVTLSLGKLPGKSSRSVPVAVQPLGANAAGDGHVSGDVIAAQTNGPNAPDIVGGREADPGAWPWQAAILRADVADGYLAQFCGGTLIAPTWVLTAGHCVTDGSGDLLPASELDVVVGRHLLSSDAGQRIGVSQIVRHPAYAQFEASADSDVALLRLATPATLSETVAPIKPLAPTQAPLADPFTTATVIGWGARNDPNVQPPDYADALHQTSVPIVSNAVCADAYAGLLGEDVITERMLCAGFAEGGKDACAGDSGGPLMVSDDQGGWLQAGIVSWGQGCAQPNYYGVYTRVTAFYDWITGDGQNTYATAGPFSVQDASGRRTEGFRQIVTVVGGPMADMPTLLIEPTLGGTLVAEIAGLDVTLAVPAGAVTQTVRIGLEAIAGQNIPADLRALGAPFTIWVFDSAGHPLSGYRFAAPVELSVDFHAVISGQESVSNVTVRRYEGEDAAWAAMSATLDDAAMRIRAPLEWAGTYAVLTGIHGTDAEQRLFLPFVDR